MYFIICTTYNFFITYSNMYINMDDLSIVLHKYFLHRCRNSVLFSVKVSLVTVLLGM